MHSLLERQRISNESVGSLDAIAVATEETDANAQVFQVRDGVLADRQSFYLDNQARRDEAEVAEEFVLQYYATSPAIPPLVVVQRALAGRRTCWPRRCRAAWRLRSRSAMPSAATSAASSSSPSGMPGSRSTRTGCAPSTAAIQRIDALEGLQRELGMPQIPMRVECFDISNLGETHTVASMVVFEGGAPKKSDYRRFGIREAVQDDFAAMNEVLGRRMAQYVAQRERSPHEASFDASFAAIPGLIVIDGGKGQLSAGLKALQPFRDLGVTVVSLAKRIEEVFIPGRRASLSCRRAARRYSYSSACATRPTGSRSSSTAAAATRR